MTDEVSVTQGECPSCGGLNLSCPEGCGRDAQGELDGSTLRPATRAERTLLTLVQLVREYLPSDGISKDEFINRVLGVLDNDQMAELVGELEAGK